MPSPSKFLNTFPDFTNTKNKTKTRKNQNKKRIKTEQITKTNKQNN